LTHETSRPRFAFSPGASDSLDRPTRCLFSGAIAAFALLAHATLAMAHQGNLGAFDVFRAGIFWMASFPGHTGLLILATWSFSKSPLRCAGR